MNTITTGSSIDAAAPANTTYVLPPTIQVTIVTAHFLRDQSTAGEHQGGGMFTSAQALELLMVLLFAVGTNTAVRIEVIGDEDVVIGYEHRLNTDPIRYTAPAPRDHHWFLYKFRALPTADPSFDPLHMLWLAAHSYAIAHYQLNICSLPVFRHVQQALATRRRDRT